MDICWNATRQNLPAGKTLNLERCTYDFDRGLKGWRYFFHQKSGGKYIEMNTAPLGNDDLHCPESRTIHGAPVQHVGVARNRFRFMDEGVTSPGSTQLLS